MSAYATPETNYHVSSHSNVATVVIHVEAIDDKPMTVTAPDSYKVSENSKLGVTITLTSTDAEQQQLATVIMTLPKKGEILYLSKKRSILQLIDLSGDLYHQRPGDPNMTKVSSPFARLNVHAVIEQYASEVVSVSSFWGSPP